MAEVEAPVSQDGWQSIRIVDASACVIFILFQKIEKMANLDVNEHWQQIKKYNDGNSTGHMWIVKRPMQA